jgi:hypothetical protein
MFKDESSESESLTGIVDRSRRAVLEQFVIGGAALAAFGFGTTTDVSAAPDAAACSNLQQLAAGKVRRVVAGTNPEGKSRIVSDTVLDTKGTIFLWTSDAQHPLGAGAADEKPFTKSPSELWSRCYIASLAPNKDPKPTRENQQGFHINPVRGVVCVFVLSGNITYLTDLDEVQLKPGDVLVMRDNRHSWRNEGTEPVQIFVAAHAVV